MTNLDIKPKAVKFIKALPPKQQRQIKDYILTLQTNPSPHDSRPLIGYESYMRADVGEYRIIYRYEQAENMIVIVLIGKRNGDEIYRLVKQNLKK